jgi:quinol monooxygenase YgiN
MTVRRYRPAGVIDDLVARVRGGVVPLLRAQPGFRGYCAFVGEEDGQIVSVSIFDDESSSDAAGEQLRAWMAAHMSDLLPDPAGPAAGTVLHHEMVLEQRWQDRPDEALFVVVREYEGARLTEEAVPLICEHILPVMRGSGFRGFYAFRDGRKPDRALSVGLWGSRGTAMAAHQRVLEVMAERMRGMFPNPPRVTAGATRVIAAA